MLIGIIFVIIFLSILILIHELGHFLTAKKMGLLVEEFGFGLPPKIWKKKIGETIYSLNALPFGGFVKILGEDGQNTNSRETNAEQREQKTNLNERNFSSLKIWKRTIIIAAGVIMNFLFGWIVLSIIFMIGIPQMVLITETKQNSPAAEIGLKNGDQIIEINNIKITTNDNKNIFGSEQVIKIINENRGKEITMKIKRNGETIDFSVIPRINPPAEEGSLGVSLIDAGLPKQNILMSFWEGLKTSLILFKTITLAIFELAIKAFVGKASLEAVTGPIGIVKITSQAGSLGFVYLLQLLALISLNLAVINIFPFPALDGGRLIFLAIEKIKGSPVNPKFEKITNAVGFGLLIFLMLAITIKDIIRL